MAEVIPEPEVLPEHPAASGLPGAGGASLIETLETVPTDESLGMEGEAISPRRLAFRRFLRHRPAMASAILLILVAILCYGAPFFTKYGYAHVPANIIDKLRLRLSGPSSAHLFGTDTLSRDEWSRVLYGGRVSLSVGIGVAAFSTIVGTFVGSVAGYFGGRLDNLLMRVTDLFLGMPLIVILILFSKAVGGSILDIVFMLGAFFWMPLARIVRGLFLSLKEKEFIEAARSMGAKPFHIITKHMLPNCLGPIMVNATLSVAAAILTESVLSFLGFGIQPPVPTWGNLLFEGKPLTTIAPWLVWFPGLAIFFTVLAVNFLGDGLRDALDPTQRRVRG